MDFSLVMSAAPHRVWYIAGDIVKVRLSLTCVPEVGGEKQKEVAPLRGVPKHNHFAVESSEADTRETDLRVGPLQAEMYGVIELNTSVMKPVHWPAAAADAKPSPNRHTAGRTKQLYALYRTGKQVLREELVLKRYECVAFEFVFRLPEGAPPTFRGKGADFRHDIAIAASWCAARTSATARAAVPRLCKVKVPLIVFNSVASVAQLPLMSLFPLPRDAALVAEQFHFEVLPLAPVPVPSAAAPLADVTHAHDSQLRTSLTVRHGAKAAMQSSLAAQKQPLSLTMPCEGVAVLQVQIQSSCVAVGDYLQGSFTVLDASAGPRESGAAARAQWKRDMEAPVAVSVTVSLELLECVTPEWALTMDAASVADTKAQGMENFVCTNKRVIDHARFSLLDTPHVPFEFSLPWGLVPASTITDIASFLWQLRVVVVAVRRSSLAQTASPGTDRLGPLLEPVAGVFPLLVVPPSMPARVRQGAATWQPSY